jgi:hypothetical protein
VVLQDKVLAGRYTLLTPLGRGGMGQVWEARDDRLDRTVAVKLLDTPEADSDLARRFTREVAVTAGLSHPGVPTIYDAGEYDGGRYLAMELVEGCTIADLIAEQGPLPVPWVAGIGAQIAAVLVAAHGRGFVHRDIKPQNVMITATGSVKILDFGVASIASVAGQRLTGTGVAVGTPAYMAPEQSNGQPATPRTDLYALGCLLYEMLSGGQVFSATSPAALMRMHLEQAPAPLRRGDLPPPLDALIRQLLAKDPAWRPADAGETYDRLLPYVIPPGPIAGITPAAHRYAAAVARLTAAQPLPLSAPLAAVPPPAVSLPAFPHYQADPALRLSPGWTIRHSLWVLPALLFGWAAWLSFGYIGVRHQRRSWLIAAAAYFVVPAIGLALIATSAGSAGSAGSNLTTQTDIGLALWLLPWPVGFIHALWVNFSVRLPLLRRTP